MTLRRKSFMRVRRCNWARLSQPCPAPGLWIAWVEGLGLESVVAIEETREAAERELERELERYLLKWLNEEDVQ